MPASRRSYAAYLNAKTQVRKGKCDASVVDKLDIIMSKLELAEEDRRAVVYAEPAPRSTACVAGALVTEEGLTALGKSSALLSCTAAMLLNSLKTLARLPDVNLIAPQALEPIQKLKRNSFGEKNVQLHADEALISLSVSASVNPMAELALEQLPKLRGSQAHLTAIPFPRRREKVLRRLGIQATCDAVFPSKRVYFGQE